VLRNETGAAFTQAIFVEPGWVYLLGALPPGAAVDLFRASRDPLIQHTGRGWPYPHGLSVGSGSRGEAEPEGPFAIVELIRGWPTDGGRAFEARRGVFLGLGSAGALGAEVAGATATRAQHAVTVVSVGRP
jgi:hypothetical protein